MKSHGSNVDRLYSGLVRPLRVKGIEIEDLTRYHKKGHSFHWSHWSSLFHLEGCYLSLCNQEPWHVRTWIQLLSSYVVHVWEWGCLHWACHIWMLVEFLLTKAMAIWMPSSYNTLVECQNKKKLRVSNQKLKISHK